MIDSMAKMPVKTMSVYSRNLESPPSGSFKGLSSASIMLDIEMNPMIIPSKMLLLVNLARKTLNLFSGPKTPSERPSSSKRVCPWVFKC